MTNSLEHLARDLRHAGRTLARMPMMAAVVILSLGIGIGVNTAVFSWIQLIVLKPIPGVADSGSFYLVEPRAETGSYPGVSWLEYRDLQERLRALPDLVAYRMVPFNIGETTQNERAYGLLVSGNYFAALGLRPAAGRFLRPEETTRPGAEPVVVISHALWRTRFGGSPDAVGRSLRANDRELTVVGVAPDGFQGTLPALQFDLFVPATLAPVLNAGSRELEDRSLRGYNVIGRLAEGATANDAELQMTRAMQELAGLYPETNRTMRGEILPFWKAPRGPRSMFLQGLVILQTVMLLLLLAVCANTANLLLARVAARQREVAVRLAVGSGPWGIVRLLAVENLTLALAGSALGVVFAIWGTTALRTVPIAMEFPIRFQTSVDAAGLAVAIGLGLACSLIFGLAPALQLARIDPQRALTTGGRGAPRGSIRSVVMAAQVALALVVLVVAGLFVGSLQETRGMDPGFKREGVLLSVYDLGARGADASDAREFANRLLARLAALPGVEGVSIATNVPLDIHGLPMTSVRVEGRATTDGSPDRALANTVTPGYFRVMDIPLAAGPGFADLADTAMSPQVIVNEEFVRRFILPGEPIGRRVEARGRTYAIAGVARNSTYEAFGEAPIPAIYFSYRDRPSSRGEIHLRTRAGGETLLAPEVRRVVRELDSALPVYGVRTLTEHVETNLFFRKIPARMFVVLGPLLLALAAIGIYAVVAYSVAHRTTEIGVRIALGATARGVVIQVVRESLRVILAGTTFGWLLAYMGYAHIGSAQHAAASSGPSVAITAFTAVPIVLLAVATIASWLPARRATKIDPMVALRQE